MTGFDRKVVHLAHDSGQPVMFTIEVDFSGDGHQSGGSFGCILQPGFQ